MLEPRERCRDVGDFLFAVVFPGAQTRAAKVEAQDRKSKRVQRLHRMENHLVVHRSAKNRVRMADESGVRRIGLANIE